MSNISFVRTFIATSLALVAFAANSIFCRLALEDRSIDASSFTAIRLLSGAIMLLLISVLVRDKNNSSPKRSWHASIMLFLYALTFSYAYITLDTGTGALILFGAVQITLIISAIISGEKLHITEWLGLFIAFSGFVYLVFPSIMKPSIYGFILMSVAGVSWGIYTLKGKNSKHPLSDTARNFMWTIPFIVILILLTFKNAHYSQKGIILAILSGAIASAIGYTIWYIALNGLSITQASVAQLSVPVIAAFGGVIFVSEQISIRLIVSALQILGGILLVIMGKFWFKTNVVYKE